CPVLAGAKARDRRVTGRESQDYGLIAGAALLWFAGTNHRIESRFWIAVATKQQRMTRPASYRPIIEPGIAVGYAPERNARDFVVMLEKHAEQFGVAAGQSLLERSRKTVCVGIEIVPACNFDAEIGRSTRRSSRQNVHIEFRNHDL